MSNVIKAANYMPVTAKKLIHLPQTEAQVAEEAAAEIDVSFEREERVREAIQSAEAAKEQIIRDAEVYAESMLAQASEEAARLREEASSEIERWWLERRQQDEAAVSEASAKGYDEGIARGTAVGEAEARSRYEQLLGEAREIVEGAVAAKHRLIQESEPFLIELSCAIAEKIIGKQLTLEPQWSVELVRSMLARRREQGIITLCVSSEYFQLMLDAREELMLAIDSQAELQIIPDPTIRGHGCVIRSSFGSIDARIDTQLSEIKKGLQQVALRSEGGEDDE